MRRGGLKNRTTKNIKKKTFLKHFPLITNSDAESPLFSADGEKEEEKIFCILFEGMEKPPPKYIFICYTFSEKRYIKAHCRISNKTRI